MTLSNSSLRPARGLPKPFLVGLVRELHARDAWLTRAGLFLLALMVPAFAASLFDPRVFEGTGVWVKPMKFLFSVGLYMLTVAWFMAYTRPAFQAGKRRTWLSAVLVSAGLFEALYITLQGGLGEASHFNNSDLLHGVLYGMMGLGALSMTAMVGWQGVEIARHKASPLAPVLRWSIALGLILTFAMTTLVGFHISSLNGPVVGIERAASDGLWLFGWSRNGGDLRVAHFIGTHAMHVLPLVGFLLVRSRLNNAAAWFGGVAIAFSMLWGFTYWQAVQGLPFLAVVG